MTDLKTWSDSELNHKRIYFLAPDRVRLFGLSDK